MPATTNPRHWLSPLTAILFVAIASTGILMWVHLRVPGVKLLHEVAGLLFTTAGIAHVVLNWRALRGCFRWRTAWIALSAGILLCALLAAMDLARGGEGEEGHRRRADQQERRT